MNEVVNRIKKKNNNLIPEQKKKLVLDSFFSQVIYG